MYFEYSVYPGFSQLMCFNHLQWQPKPSSSTNHGSAEVDRESSLLDLVLAFVLSELQFHQLCLPGVEDGPLSSELEMNINSASLGQLELQTISCFLFLERLICLRALYPQLNHKPSLLNFL